MTVETLGGNKPLTDMDMAELWDWLYAHPQFYCEAQLCESLPHNIDIQYVRVNPDTDAVDDDPACNTQVQVWLEFGPWHYLENEDLHGELPQWQRWVPSHDLNLDCGGDTFEEAFRELCNLVLRYYGDYERTGP